MAFSAVSGEMLLNQTIANTQENPAVAVRPDGTAIAVWDGIGANTLYSVYGRLVGRDGTPLSGEFLVSQNTLTSQVTPAVATDSAGNFAVVWVSRKGGVVNTSSLIYRLYNADGTPRTNEVVVDTTAGVEQAPAAAFDASGNLLIVWNRQGAAATPGIFAQRFDATGAAVGGQVTVKQQLSAPVDAPAIATGPGGSFVVTWTERGGGQTKIKAQRFDAAGTGQGEFAVQTNATNNADVSSVATDAAGNFVVAWGEQYSDTATSFGVLFRRFAADGTSLSGAVLANQTTANDQKAPSVAMSPTGYFVIAWQSDLQDGSGRGVYLRPFNPTGQALAGEQRVNATTANDQLAPHVAVNASGAVAAVWQGNGTGDADGVFLRTYSWPEAGSNAAPVANPDGYATDEGVSLTVGAGGGVLANDSDANGDPLTASIASGPANGAVALNLDGSFTYTPAANYFGTDSFTYTVSDARGGTATGTVNITVNAVNDAPTFSLIGNPPRVDEDAGPQTVVGFATGISPGPSNESGQTLTFLATGNTNAGLFSAGPSIASNGTLTYTPAADASGTATITIVLQDNGGSSNGGQDTSTSRTFTITVRAVNDSPTLDPVSNVTVPEDAGPQTVSLTGITAGGGETQTLQVTATSSNPALIPNPTITYTSPNAAGTLNFTSNPNANGTTTIVVTVRDAGRNWFLGDADDATTTRTFTATVTATPDAPVANPDTYSTAGGIQLAIAAAGVLGNDTDADGDLLTAAFETGPANGTLVLLPDGSFTYTPDAGFSGVDSFTYRAVDSTGLTSAPATVTINVALGNRPPTAGNDAFTTAEDTLLAGTVLGNDSDPDGDTLIVSLLGGGTTNGSLILNSNGTFTYTPDANFNGTDSFDYTLSDGNGGTSTATVTLTVTAVNDPPVAIDDTGPVTEDGAVTIDVRANDTDTENDPLTVVGVTQPANGTVVTDGFSVTYTPNADYNGSDTFTYTISDGNGGTATGTVTLTVTAVNDAPTLDVISDVTVAEDNGSQTLSLTGITAGGGETQTLAFSVTSSDPSLIPNPTVSYTSPNTTGTLTFAPNPNANGIATITVSVDDGVTTANRTFNVTVTGVNDAPTISTIADQTIPEDNTVGPLAFTVGDVETPPGSLTVTATSNNPALIPNANVTITPTGAGGREITLVPSPNANGSAVITVTVSDGVSSTSSTFVVNVTAVNDAPTAADDSYSTTRDTTLVVPASGTLINDTDIDGDILTATVITGPQNGTLQLNPDGSFVYNPNPGFVGTDTFTYTAADSSGATSGTATVAITVAAVNDAPTISAIADQTIPEDGTVGPLAFTVGDVETPPGSLTVTATSNNPALIPNANITITPTGAGGRQITLVPSPNANGSAVITVTVSDGVSSTSTTFVVNVTAVNDAPTVADDSYSTTRDTTLVVPASGTLINDTDIDGDILTATVITGPQNGTLQLNPDGSFVYNPNPGFVGTDTFTYTAADSSGATSGTATVTINVTLPTVTAPGPTITGPSDPTDRPPTVDTNPTDNTPDAGPTAPARQAPPLPRLAPGPVERDTGSGSATYPVGVTSAAPGATASPAEGGTPVLARDTTPVFFSAVANDIPIEAAPGEAKLPGPIALPPESKSPPPESPAATARPTTNPVAIAPPAPVVAVPTIPAPENPDAVADLRTGLDKIAEDLGADADERAATDAVVTTAVVATAGYVLLNTRAVHWFISALLARPAVWRRFDPIDVIYSWEREQELGTGPDPTPNKDDESLQSMVN